MLGMVLPIEDTVIYKKEVAPALVWISLEVAPLDTETCNKYYTEWMKTNIMWEWMTKAYP